MDAMSTELQVVEKQRILACHDLEQGIGPVRNESDHDVWQCG